MKAYSGGQYIIRFKNGTLWHFFSNKNQSINYRKLGEDGEWGNPKVLIQNVQEEFGICIDRQNCLHLLCLSSKGEILYMRYDGTSWSKQILSRYDPNRYMVRYPGIVSSQNRIHILFTIGMAFNVGLWSLYHYCWNGSKWNHQEVTKYTAGRTLTPFYFDIYHQDIHLIYRGMSTKNFQIFHCRYDNSEEKWHLPHSISSSSYNSHMPSLLIQSGRLHVTWSSMKNNHLQVFYRPMSLDLVEDEPLLDEKLLSDSDTNCIYPILIWLENKLYCMWLQEGDIFVRWSVDSGNSWGQCSPLHFPDPDSCCQIRYCSNFPPDNDSLNLYRGYANMENALIFPLLRNWPTVDVFSKPPVPPSYAPQNNDTSVPENKGMENDDLIKEIEHWIDKAKKAYHHQCSINQKIETIRRQGMEDRRQWELLLEEFDKLKIDVEKLRNRSLLRKLLNPWRDK